MSATSKSHKSRKTSGSEPSSSESSARMGLAPPPDSAIGLQTSPAPITHNALEPTQTPVEKPAKSQYWYRTADSKTRKIFEKIIVMREAGRQDADIAKRIGTTAQNVAQTVWIAKKNGWMDGEGEIVDIEAELAVNIDRKIVRNLSASLDGGMTNWQTHEMTIAAAKGRGHFKNHEVSKGDGGPQQLQVVAIQVVMPTLGAADQGEISEDQMGGQPAYLEGDTYATPEPTTPIRDSNSSSDYSVVLK